MSSTLTLVVIAIIFVFNKKCILPMFIHAFYDQVVFVILPTFRENFQRKRLFLYSCKGSGNSDQNFYNPGHAT